MQLSNKEIVFYVVAGTFVLLSIGFFIVLFILLYNRKQKQFEQQREEAEKVFGKALLQAKYEIREATVKDLGRELHDNIGQVASLIKIHLHSIDLSKSTEAEHELETVKELLRSLIRDVKLISRDLIQSTPLQYGLWESIIRDIEKINALGIMSIRCSLDHDLPRWDVASEIIWYRMTQEVFQNIIKHSQARNVTLEAQVVNGILTLTISDDGIGFDVGTGRFKGSGLSNLQERAVAVGGSLEVDSRPGIGTKIVISKSV